MHFYRRSTQEAKLISSASVRFLLARDEDLYQQTSPFSSLLITGKLAPVENRLLLPGRIALMKDQLAHRYDWDCHETDAFKTIPASKSGIPRRNSCLG
jgi:hypothetical protein